MLMMMPWWWWWWWCHDGDDDDGYYDDNDGMTEEQCRGYRWPIMPSPQSNGGKWKKVKERGNGRGVEALHSLSLSPNLVLLLVSNSFTKWDLAPPPPGLYDTSAPSTVFINATPHIFTLTLKFHTLKIQHPVPCEQSDPKALMVHVLTIIMNVQRLMVLMINCYIASFASVNKMTW